ncbi:MAG: CidA/LrgA family protein [Opitutae bacterium]|nr:CidA/LrgA family protein [Opitutae bacterium]
MVPPPKPSAGKLLRAGRTVLGLAIILGCFLAGEFFKRRFGLIVPGSVLGLFLLLALLITRVVRLDWVEEASRLLLFLLPVFFVPIYVNATEDRVLWREWGVVIAGTLAVTVILLWIFVGRLAQRALGRAAGKEKP